ncbi:hypothetical protein NDU88_009056 [Pleurodeles waltl]|uniref:Integrase catalytic domain-containing protein n=1 Tax=Pleurodeles waltl TaxID=8319 RepID=A0AAV7PTJ8_PLEWA|nr:hypothetical protein NDU88_009056 [Pleurodeles waltl]
MEGPPSAQAAKWKLWVERLENYFAATALHPRDKGRCIFTWAERFMRTLNKVLRIVVAKGKNIDCAIFEFLREYRLTPHSTTGVSPSSICIQREVRDTIPHVGNTTMKQKQVETLLRNRYTHNERISRKRRARMRHLKAGDVVLVKNRHPGGKFKTPFEPELWTVARVKGTLVTAMRKGETVMRNISCFKLYHGKPLKSEGTEVNSGPSSVDEGVLLDSPFQASGELEERDTTSLKVPEGSEERITAEVPSAIIREEVWTDIVYDPIFRSLKS